MPSNKTSFEAFREAKGYTQRGLAKHLRVSGNTVAGWDRGAIPAGDKLVELAGLMGTTPDYLLRLIEQSRPTKKSAA